MFSSCKIKIIAKAIDDTGILELGEVVNTAEDNLEKIHSELQYLTPFRSRKNFPHNIHDMRYFQKAYCDDTLITLSGHGKNFHAPILWDDTCSTPVYAKTYIPRGIIYNPKRYCIVLPCKNVVERGRLLNRVLDYHPSTIVVTGDKVGENRDTEATLCSRYLVYSGYNPENIIKYRESNEPESILDCLCILTLPSDSIIYIACPSNDIGKIRMLLKNWRRKSLHKVKRFYFITD
jgi:hypothetical protein